MKHFTELYLTLELNKECVTLYEANNLHLCRDGRPTSDLAADLATPPPTRNSYFDWSVSTSALQTGVFATVKFVIVEIKLQNCDKPQFLTLANVLC